MRILGPREIRSLLPMAECVEVMEGALRTLAGGDAVQPLRSILWLPDRTGLLGLMPGFLGGEDPVTGLKAITVVPKNLDTPFDSHQGAILLFETAHGRLLAILDASAITAIRTAAVSGVATRALARPDAADLAILGSGVQATEHLAAMRVARPIRSVRVWSRSAEKARAFAARESSRHGIPVEAMAEAREAVRGAEIICTTTGASGPVLLGEWIAPGAHVNAVGACIPSSRELDTHAVLRSRVVVDRLESALAEAGDLLIPIREGAIGAGHIAGELGDLLRGAFPGRREAEEITLFKSLGIAVEDLAAARHVYARAVATGQGAVLDWEGSHHAAD